MVAALQDVELRQEIIEAGFSVSGTTRADTDRMRRVEAQRWAAIVRASGFRAIDQYRGCGDSVSGLRSEVRASP